jgi:hypothetical protein
MRSITMATPVSKCQEVADHAVHMLAKFPENPRLAEMSRRLSEGFRSLEAAELAFQAAKRAAQRTRIDVRYENYVSDLCMRRVKKQVEAQDTHRGGRVTSLVSDGAPDFTRLQGKKQVDAMRQFELRLVSVQDIWTGAVVEVAKVIEHRMRYEDALDAREQGKRDTQEARVNRNTAKERFVQLYAEIISLVKAEFPRDRHTQELFFLDPYPGRGGTGEADDDIDDIDDGDELPELPEDPDADPAVTP